MVASEEPILSRLDRLDNMLRRLEEVRECGRSPKSSCASTPSSGTLTSEWHTSSVDLSPKNLDKHCRSINHVMKLTQVKGSLMERMDHVEDKVLRLCSQLEVEIEGERRRLQKMEKKGKKKSFKLILQQCMRGGGDGKQHESSYS